MKSFDVVGYAYEAAVHCEDCTRSRFPNANDEFSDVEDTEGNEVHPVFVDNASPDGEYCDDCGDELYEPCDNESID